MTLDVEAGHRCWCGQRLTVDNLFAAVCPQGHPSHTGVGSEAHCPPCYEDAQVEERLTRIGEERRRMGAEALRCLPHPKLYEAARAIVQARYEAGDYEAQYQAAWAKYAALVPCSVREARAEEEVVEALARDLAEILDGALEDWAIEVAK